MSAYYWYRKSNPDSDGVVEGIVFLLFLIGLVCYGLYMGATYLWGYDYQFCGTTVSYPELYDPYKGSSYVYIDLVEYPDVRFTANTKYIHTEPGTVVHITVRYLGRNIPGRLSVDEIEFVESCENVPTTSPWVHTILVGGNMKMFKEFVYWYFEYYPLIISVVLILFGASLFMWTRKFSTATNAYRKEARLQQLERELDQRKQITLSISEEHLKVIRRRETVSRVMSLLSGMSISWGVMKILNFFM